MKHKLTALTLIALILFSVFPFTANAKEPNCVISIKGTETNSDCEYILPYKDVEISVSSDIEIGLLGICFYGGSGALNDFKFLSDVKNYTEVLTVDEQTYKIKIIGWDSIENMSPVIFSKEVSREFMPSRPDGFGTNDNPFIITSADELAYIFAENTKHFELANDIDLGNNVWYPAAFCGVFDGKGHSVTSLKSVDYLKTTGFVSELRPASNNINNPSCIKNLKVEIEDSGSSAEISGGIAGELTSPSSIILNCSTTGNITSSYVGGGIVGKTNSGQIEECTSSANVTVFGNKDTLAGGISGVSFLKDTDLYPRIIGCDSSGVIQTRTDSDSSNSYLSLSGGITAYNQGYIKNCRSSAKLYSSGKTGGITAKDGDKIENRCDIVDCIDNTTVINSSSLIFDGGNGSKENPYKISNAIQLNEVRNFLSSSFIQTCDIDLSGLGTSDQNPNSGWSSIGSADYPYTGNYDGNGFCINNLTITIASEHTGFFGYSTGTIKNVTLHNGNVTVSGDLGDYSNSVAIGMVLGENRGTLSNCKVDGNVNATAELTGVYNVSVGGIVGRNYGTVEKCGNSSGVSIVQDFRISSNSSTSSLWLAAGGIAGETRGGIIKNCYNLGEVNCAVPTSDLDVPFEDYQSGNFTNNTGSVLPNIEESPGGIAGYSNKGKIQNCYTSGKQTAYSVYGPVYIDMGRIAGLCSNASTYISNCYYNINSPTLINGVQVTDNTVISGLKIKAYGTAVTAAEMKSAEFAEKLGTAFKEDVKQENFGYPVFQNQ